MLKKVAIVVAGGTGTRMGADLPKQFMLLANKPVMMHTLEKFYQSGCELIVVLNVDYHDHWKSLCKQHSLEIPHTLIKGGRNRFESVKNGLKSISENALVAIHDAVRPLIDIETINKAFDCADKNGNAVVVVPSKDSLRKVENDNSYSVPRSDYFIVQTPQIFEKNILDKAYKEEFRNEFTDDASVVEKLGIKIHLVEGKQSNIKITYAEDLAIAETLLKM
ncbi:MAG: 2-C-methyl-D-erythritol 4-phosphate cytidylyltransferase [bacterium]|jgi:2-C-methyl-D-erythritol 4-phosphate cytidylyltransferase